MSARAAARPESTDDALAARLARVPDRRIPVLYFVFAHLCLLGALATVAWDPRGVAGFFYHPRMLGVVHLVTLGWVSSSILGALYMIGPMALRTPVPARRLDTWAFAGYAVGVAGMVGHLWINEPQGMVWSAGLVVLSALRVAWLVGGGIRRSPLPPEVKLHFYLSFGNFFLAAALGLLIGLDKSLHLLPGYILSKVYAHAHLAALGWATMMVMAAGYRLLPMLLPAALPAGTGVWASALLLEAGVLGLTGTLLAGSRWALIFGLLCLGGLAAFLSRVGWMLRHRRPAPKALPRPDWGVLHVACALFYLMTAAVLGCVLLLAPASPWKIRTAMAYGAVGLVGFLTQIVVGVAARLFPLYAWLRSFADTAFSRPPASPHSLPFRAVQAAVFALWLAGVPLLVTSLALDRYGLLQVAAVLLFAAVALNLSQEIRVLHRARESRVRSPELPVAITRHDSRLSTHGSRPGGRAGD